MRILQVRLLIAFVLLLGAAGSTQGATFKIVEVLFGSSGGFGYSGFHDANDNSPMTGATLADVGPATGMFGTFTYDTMTGDGSLAATLPVSVAGPTFTLSGGLSFNTVSGLLGQNATLNVNFAGTGVGLVDDTQIGLKPGDVCCSGAFDPNSFNPDGSGSMIMSLWGASWSGANGTTFAGVFGGSYAGSKLGMDLRLKLAPVPLPPAVWLFGSALVGLVGVARRNRGRAVAA